MNNPVSREKFFHIRKQLRIKYFNEPHFLKIHEISQFKIDNIDRIIPYYRDIYFFSFYLNPTRTRTKTYSPTRTDMLESTIQNIISQKTEKPNINFKQIYKYLDELPTNIVDHNNRIISDQKQAREIFEKYKNELLALNKPSNNQQLWI